MLKSYGQHRGPVTNRRSCGNRIANVLHRHARAVQAHALNIDRRQHLSLAWERQKQREEWISNLDVASGSVITCLDMADLEAILQRAGSSVVILFFTSKTCGVCKEAGVTFENMARDAARARARVVFLKADVFSEYDTWSDIAQHYRIRSVPSFLFMAEGGSVVKRLFLSDVRRLTGSTAWIQSVLQADMRRLKESINEVLLKRAPSTLP